jgi:hypothetical protein
MGVAFFIIPLMLAILVAPILYFVLMFFFVKKAKKNRSKKKGNIEATLIFILFLIYPVLLCIEYLNFSAKCENTFPNPDVAPISDVDSIAFIIEGGAGVRKPFFSYREMMLDVSKFEYGYIVDGKEVMQHLCHGSLRDHDCEQTGEITNRYMFKVSAAKRNSNFVLQSDVLVVDRSTGKILYKANEYVLYNSSFGVQNGELFALTS